MLSLASIASQIGTGLGAVIRPVPQVFAAILNDTPAPTSPPVETNETVDPESLLKAAEASLTSFHENLQRKFRAAGIDLTHAITLTSDGFGGVQVNIDHPQYRVIEDVFHGDASLAARFHQLGSQFSAAQQAGHGQTPDLETFEVRIAAGKCEARFASTLGSHVA